MITAANIFLPLLPAAAFIGRSSLLALAALILNLNLMLKRLLPACLFFFAFMPATVHAQKLLTDVMDTSTDIGKGFYSVYTTYNNLRFSGYMQPQFQAVGDKGAKSFGGGDFPAASDNRFTLRRGRLKIDYLRTTAGHYPSVAFVFQFDGTERGVFIRDFYGRFFENKWHALSVTTGMFARPFGYEVNLGSADRESPERGRMSQILMKTERDLGAMLTLEPRDPNSTFKWLRVDIGLFNGQGLSGTTDYDSHKDLIGRIYVKPRLLNGTDIHLSGGVSGYYGGITSQGNVLFTTLYNNNNPYQLRDSNTTNNGRLVPRRYAGADAQLLIPNKHGATEFRGEVIFGRQTATAATSETPGIYPTGQPLYTRRFNGAYFYFLQHLGSTRHQLVLKYDWYDPNSTVKGADIRADNGFTAADIKYQTFSAGYLYYINPNLKLTLWYDHIINENTSLVGYTKDLKDDLITVRMQFRF